MERCRICDGRATHELKSGKESDYFCTKCGKLVMEMWREVIDEHKLPVSIVDTTRTD